MLSRVKLASLLAVVLASCGAPAHAVSYGVHTVSIHSERNTGVGAFNNINPGAYVRLDNGLTFGGYYNSERRVTTYAGFTHTLSKVGLPNASLSWLAVTGYGGVKFGPVPSYLVTPHLRIGFVPKTQKGGAHVLNLMYEV